MDELVRQVRFAVRKLMRAPFFTTMSVVTLAVGIGANAAIFSVVDGVLLKPLPYEAADRLVELGHVAPGVGVTDAGQAEATYLTYRADNTVFEDIGLWSRHSVTITGAGDPERVTAVTVTDGTLGLLGAVPATGRLFTAADDGPGAPATTVLGHGYWQRRFGGGLAAIGEVLRINGQPHEIIGVTERSFNIVEYEPDVYVTARFDPAQAVFSFSYAAIGRLKAGVSIAAAETDLGRLINVAADRYPGPFTKEQLAEIGFRPRVVPLKSALVGDVSTVLWVLVGTVGLVLLLACANVANLFLVQAESRQREVALRAALGASRRSVVGAFLTESAMLGLLAGGLGLVLASLGLRLLLLTGPNSLPRMEGIGIDGRVVAFAIAVSLFAALLFGLYPSLRYGRGDLQSVLKEGGRAAGAGRERHRVRNGLIVVQVALALVLLIGSGLMVRSVQALRRVDPGFAGADALVALRLHVPDAEIGDDRAVAELHLAMRDRLAAVPGVVSVGSSSSFALGGGLTSNNPIAIEGRPIETSQIPPVRRYQFTGPGYHETLQTRLVAGRLLTRSDIDSRAKVVVVNEALARAEWDEPTAAIGHRVRDFISEDWYEIVGVTASIRYDGLTQPEPAVVYWPLVLERFWGSEPLVPRSLDYVLRTAGEPLALVSQIREAVWSVNSNLAVANVRAVADMARRSLARPAFAMVMLSIAALVALVLGLVGIYGVISYIVSQRTQEIGVRMAIGAAPGRVRRMVVRQAAAVIAIGVGVGLGVAVLLTRLMAGLLYGVAPVDAVTYGAVTATIVVVGLLASYLPARSAARVDPVTALRAESR